METETEPPQFQPSYLGALFLSLCKSWSLLSYGDIFPPCNSPCDISGTLWNSPLLFFADFADGLHHESPGLCGHHAVKLRQRLPQGRKERMEGRRGMGGQGGRKCRTEAVGGKQDPSVLDLSDDTITGVSFWTNKKSTSHGFGFRLIIPSLLLLCVGSEGASWCVRE